MSLWEALSAKDSSTLRNSLALSMANTYVYGNYSVICFLSVSKLLLLFCIFEENTTFHNCQLSIVLNDVSTRCVCVMLNIKYTHNGNGSHQCNIEMIKQVIELKPPLPIVLTVSRVIVLTSKNKQKKGVSWVLFFYMDSRQKRNNKACRFSLLLKR